MRSSAGRSAPAGRWKLSPKSAARLAPALVAATLAFAQYNIGHAPSADEIRGADITVLPDGSGLPAGQGSAVAGELIYAARCAECHGPKAEGRKGEYPALVGGRGTLATPKPVKTVGSYWPYATTV